MRAFHQKINGVISAVGPSQVTRSGRKVRLTTAAAVIVAMVPASIRVRCREMRAFPTTGPARQSRQSDSAIVSPIEPKTSRIALGAVLGLIGPFGTFEALPILPRLGYWLAIAALNWLLCDIAIRRVDDVLPEDIAVRRILVPLVGAVLVSLPATGVVALAGGVSGIGSPDSILSLYWKVALLLVAISLPVYTFADLREAAEAAAPLPSHAPANSAEARSESTGLSLFQARLPRPLEGRLLCLEMQDHYLAVHTTEGSELILCRMEDAARELGALGRRVHRSWWVAADAVAGAERDGQRLMLRLCDGRRVPVGRTYRDGLRAEGWLGVHRLRVPRE
jgi:hypothetical protein